MPRGAFSLFFTVFFVTYLILALQVNGQYVPAFQLYLLVKPESVQVDFVVWSVEYCQAFL